jgi:putative addiction module component (TIGR02574 family)
MDIYSDTIRDLGPAEKLQLVEQIWDDLAAEASPLPPPRDAGRSVIES